MKIVWLAVRTAVRQSRARPFSARRSSSCHQRAVALAMFVCSIAVAQAKAELLYTATFADGTIVTHAKMTEWWTATQQPKIDGRLLFDENNPVRWVRLDSYKPVQPPERFVEFVGGDRFPCEVTGFHEHALSDYRTLPPHLVVQPDGSIDRPGVQRKTVRVHVAPLRRIVWSSRGGHGYSPATVYLRDGRQLAYRSLRWSARGVSLLTDEGTRQVEFRQMAELHLPRRDSWDAWFETLVRIAPELTSRLMRIETAAGLVGSSSVAQFQAQGGGNPDSWIHMIHPAWSLDPLWIPHREIQDRRFFTPDRMPLTVVDPSRTSGGATIGGQRGWQRDRNVFGHPLNSGERSYGWGFGMWAQSRLEFELPACVTAFETAAGLDRTSGSGGCVRVSAGLSQAEKPLYQSDFLVGSAAVVKTGRLELADAGSPRTLWLKTDPAHQGRPKGADPFNVRDAIDWLEPELYVDPAKLPRLVEPHLPGAIAAWDGWTVDSVDGLTVSYQWDTSNALDWRHYVQTTPVGHAMSLTRSVRVTPSTDYLCVGVSRLVNSSNSRIEILVDGEPLAEFNVVQLAAAQTSPQLIGLHDFRGREITVTLVHWPSDANGRVHWQSLGFLADRTPTPWQTLEVAEARSADGATLTVQPDGAVLAEGKIAPFESYTVVGSTKQKQITAIRLEALNDSRISGSGPGRAGGSFALTDFRVTTHPPGKPDEIRRLEFESPSTDFHQPGYPIDAVTDSDVKTAWRISPQHGRPHVAIFPLRDKLNCDERTVFSFRLDHQAFANHALGKFRLSTTRARLPIPAELPAPVVERQKAEQFAVRPIPAPAADQETTDLFVGLVVDDSTATGKWESKDGGWLATGDDPSLELPVGSARNYELELRVIRQAGEGQIVLGLPVRSTRATLRLGGKTDGIAHGQSPSEFSIPIATGREHLLRVRTTVLSDLVFIDATVDGAGRLRWEGRVSDLARDAIWKTPESNRFGLAATGAEVIFKGAVFRTRQRQPE